MSNNPRSILTLSVKDKNLNPALNTKFITSSFDVTNLQQVFTTHNYSAIIFRGHRDEEHFDYATSVMLDIDTGMTIQEAESILDQNNLNRAIVTSKSHTDTAHRFRIIIPTSRRIHSVENYREAVRDLKTAMFPSVDPNAMDAARFFFSSPSTAYYSCKWNGTDYDPDQNSGNQILSAWAGHLKVTTSKRKDFYADLLDDKTPIFCPFHDDKSASAFVKHNTNGEQFIHCSACGKTFWKVKETIEKRCKDYWSYSTDYLEFGIAGEKFFMEKVTKEKWLVFINAFEKNEKDQALKYLLHNKHIRHIKRVEHVGDANINKSTYDVDIDNAVVTAKYAPIRADLEDNDFIENYLEALFGEHKAFIKQWLAAYCYTNYKKLPTLILKGERGSGKSKFAEMIYKIFPSISQMWEANKGNFSPEAEKKLLVADETVCNEEKQYNMLKQYSGQEFATVNHKYLRQYEVPNNMNIVIMSNREIPIYVARDEKPTSEENNQFFVYNFKQFPGPIDPEIPKKLEQRIGHYIRTELKTVFDGLDSSGKRYTINAPITPEEAGLFEGNITEEESDADILIDKIVDHVADPKCQYEEFLKAKLLPRPLIEYLKGFTSASADALVKQLREQKYLDMNFVEKKQIDKVRKSVYKMTDKLYSQLKFYNPNAKKAA